MIGSKDKGFLVFLQSNNKELTFNQAVFFKRFFWG
ncbi:Hypothetical protein HPV225_0092 [Helicobacter pylori v225d]|nr:Hypothetical protein HPV225_0092 [Helicobacter pylori v225d]